MEDAVSTWGERLESVVRQEVERAREVTKWAQGELETEARGTATIDQKTGDRRPSCRCAGVSVQFFHF